MLYRFEIKGILRQMGIYHALSPIIISDFLQELDIVPCPNIFEREPITFFFTKRGLYKYASCLEEVFTNCELIEYFEDNNFTLMGLKMLKPDLKPIYEDEYQVCYKSKFLDLLDDFQPIQTLKEWDSFIGFPN